MEALQAWEDEKVIENEKANGKKEKKRKGAGSLDKSLTAGHSTGVRMEQLQGYFWPLDVYKRVKKQQPDKSLVIRTFGLVLQSRSQVFINLSG